MKKNQESFAALINTHDLSLPEWGPYSKKYFGLSHVADSRRGLRFDFTVMPGIYRRDICLPDALKEAGYSPWETATDLNYYSYRQQIEWQDRVYCDISFCRIDDHTRLMRCVAVNRTERSAALALHLVAGLELPPVHTLEPQLPAGAEWHHAVDHNGLDYAISRPQDNLVYDALRRGEESYADTVSGSCIGKGFGKDAGDRIELPVATAKSNTVIILRYLLPPGEKLTLHLSGAAEGVATLTGTGKFAISPVFTGRLNAGELIINSGGGAEIKLDGWTAVTPGEEDSITFTPTSRDNTPSFTDGPVADSTLIGFPLVKQSYGLWWSESGALRRRYQVHSLKETILYDDAVHQHYCNNFDRGGNDRYTDILIQPVTVAPGATRTVYAVIGTGTPEELRLRLAAVPKKPDELETIHRREQQDALRLETTAAGEKFRFSQERMAAVTMTNVVYPTYIKRGFVKHSPPGRCWNSLYSWDSGFIGLGLLELDTRRAVENLNAYVTEPGDPETAFVHHGTPLPVQHYLYLELWNRTHDREMLAFFYPRLRQFYRFLAGDAPSSTTRRTTSSGLLKTWDYFYNSGGWDDYPPQWVIHQGHLHHIAPAVSTSHAIRAAKILTMAAEELGLDDDVAAYRRDIDRFATALQTHAWDAESGYFSYVEHDRNGDPTGFYRHASGTNFNMGLDGLSPLVAGICTAEQRALFWSRLQSEERFWTAVGLSTVDRSAPYYRCDGYWNGAVWMPHQWFFWKAALNDGQADFAWRIAATALRVWERETRASHYCFEHFAIESERGCGWHHFSGLSTPVLSWHGAYYRPGRLTAGYDVWINAPEHDAANGSLSAELRIAGNAGETTTVIAVVGEGDFTADYSGGDCTLRVRLPGTVEVDLPKATAGRLTIAARRQSTAI